MDVKGYLNTYVEVLKNFGDFKGRTGRARFWTFMLVSILVSVVLGLISDILSGIYSLVVLVPALAVSVRRLHDIGKSGLNLLWLFLPFIGWIYLIYLYIQEGEPSANKWGSPPPEA